MADPIDPKLLILHVDDRILNEKGGEPGERLPAAQ
jgi:hypothetical protein